MHRTLAEPRPDLLSQAVQDGAPPSLPSTIPNVKAATAAKSALRRGVQLATADAFYGSLSGILGTLF